MNIERTLFANLNQVNNPSHNYKAKTAKQKKQKKDQKHNKTKTKRKQNLSNK